MIKSKISSEILQRIMDRDLRDKGVDVYMDDIVVYGKSIIEHDNLVIEALKRLRENNVRINLAKVQFP